MQRVKIVDALFVHDRRILLVQQGRPRAYTLWSLPGGHVESGESARRAIRREVQEELGLALPPASLEEKIDHAEEGTDEGALFVTTFIVRMEAMPRRLQPEEIISFGWFSLEEIRALSPQLRSSWIVGLAEQFVGSH